MYNWPECYVKRGCNEVISCLHHYIQANVPQSVTHLNFFVMGRVENKTTIMQ